MKNRRTSKLMAVFIALIMVLSESVPVLAEITDSSNITISTVDDFMSFASKCSLDTWSRKKTITLANDLDLSDSEFQCIPIFGGTFDGDGHSIIGVNITSAGSTQGFFRYLQSGGIIKNLTIVGTVTPGGTKCNVGGIVGSNSGSVQDCVFAGIVSGDTTVGEIVGLNTESGTISGCKSRGTVNGKKNTGGICGKNLGSIIKCSGGCSVNTTSVETKMSIDDIDLDLNSTIDDLTSLSSSEEEDKTLTSHTDTGGIVGYSSGIVQGCTNTGVIGYQHMGYNVGGIAGRQSGYLAGCTNNGTVYGRKDVGGIVGQTEPYIIMNMTGDVLSQLQNELNNLQSMINDSLDEASSSSDTISAQLTTISGYTDSARDDAKSLADQTTDFVDNNIGEVNDIGAEISNTLDKMVGVLDDAESASDTSTKALRQLKKALNSMEDSSDSGLDTIKSAEQSVDDLIKANDAAKNAVENINEGLKTLDDAISTNDLDINDEIKSLGDLAEQINVLSDAMDSEGKAVESLRNVLSNSSSLSDLISSSDDLIAALDKQKTSLDDMSSALSASADTLSPLLGNVSVDEDKVQEALKLFAASFDDIKDAMSSGSEALNGLNEVLDNASDAAESLSDAISQMADATGTISKAASYLTDSVSEFRDLVEDLSNEEPIEFDKLGDDFRTTSDNLYSSLNSISEGMNNLNDTISSSTKDFINNAKAINSQFNKVMGVVITAVTDLQNSGDGTDLSQYIQDTSDTNISGTRLGKVADCHNTGEIQADRNVGGIVGSMDIEYDLDPESDLTGTNIFRTTYETRSVLEDCVNEGNIISKKDSVGGIAGRMNLGTIFECENYGGIESSNGDYIGGIAGTANATIRNSYSKCTLKGDNYIGGIAGSATKLDSCYSIVSIDGGEECLGAIAGKGDDESGNITNNYFVSDTLAGIDGISYSGCAEPISFDDLRIKEGLPSEFISFTITFVADDVTIETLPVKYGDRLYEIELPEVPKRDGYYGKWPDFATDKVTESIVAEAQYTPWVEVVASTELQQNGKKSLALAEGQFTDDAVLHVSDSSEKPPKEANACESVNVWDISLLGTDVSESDTVSIRLLNEGGGKAHVWQMKDGSWKEVETDVNGHYLKLDMEGTDATFCIASNNIQFDDKPIIGACMLGLALTVYVITNIKKRHKNKIEVKDKIRNEILKRKELSIKKIMRKKDNKE
ncbi:MAG: hypothetical protein VB119_09280 [Candidatus Metalachnospira sp.]|nr:hypothetical protein [Candidatus Metalachnospira sp.]